MGACRPDYATRLDSESQIQRDRARVFSELSRLLRGYEAQRKQTLTARMPVEFMGQEINSNAHQIGDSRSRRSHRTDHHADHPGRRNLRAALGLDGDNFVVGTNSRAIALWRRVGFEIVGWLPGAFRHPTLGFVDAPVMFRKL